jgi:hypothetical protein
MPTHAEHSVKNYKFSNFFKQVKNVQKVKILTNHLETWKWVKKPQAIFTLFYCSANVAVVFSST